jgi:putative ABC transport system permease protein
MAAAIRQEIYQIDPEQSVANVKTLEQVISDSVAPRRLSAVLLGIFASVALALASVGTYGVLSYLVTQRKHEIGIRMALGADHKEVLKLVVGQGLQLALLGVGIGLMASLALTRFLENMLFAVCRTDPITFGVVSLVLISAALLASYIPARRATKVDPMVALRHE